MSEKSTVFFPNARYATRCWVNALLAWTFAAGLWCVAGGIALGIKEGVAAGLALIVLPNLLFLVGAAWYIPLWVKSIRYEMTDEEIIVQKGVLNKIDKIVPYRTVTNVTITRAWLDRVALGIGNVNVQTAGAGGTSIAEERLVGLRNFQEIREAIVTNLRRYRADTGPALGGGRAGIPAPSEPAASTVVAQGGTLESILTELRAIRELMEKR